MFHIKIRMEEHHKAERDHREEAGLDSYLAVTCGTMVMGY